MGDALRRTQRLASLLQQLAEEDGGHGSKSRAARRIGISQGYAAKIVSGLRTNVSDDVIREAAQALDLSEDFFTAGGPPDLDYHAFLGGQKVGAWDAWVEQEGAGSSQDELDTVRAMAMAAADRGELVTPALLSALLIAVRMSRMGATRSG